jgi:hypothetical protein
VKADPQAERSALHFRDIVGPRRRRNQAEHRAMQQIIANAGYHGQFPSSMVRPGNEIEGVRFDTKHGIVDGCAAGMTRVFSAGRRRPHLSGQGRSTASPKAVHLRLKPSHMPAEVNDDRMPGILNTPVGWLADIVTAKD